MLFVLGAVTEQRDRLLLSEVLEQSQSKLLPVILDPVIARIDAAGLEKFLPITAAIVAPRYFTGQDSVAQLFRRPDVGHPDIEPVRRQTATSSPRCQNPKAIARFDGTVD